MANLNDRQRTFCQYMANGRHTIKAAAVAAGYSEDTAGAQASKLLRKVKIQAYIKELREQREKSAGIDALWITQELISVHERCSKGEPVLDKDGAPVGIWKIDASGSNKALDTLAKMGGHYEKDNKQKQQVVSFEMKL